MDESGLPSPRQFACRGCGVELGVSEMAVEVAGDGDSERALQPPLWMDGKFGFIRSYFGTIWRVHFSPARVVRGAEAAGSTGDAAGFAFFVLTPVTLLAISPVIALTAVLQASESESIPATVVFSICMGAIYALLSTVAMVLLVVPFNALLVHAALSLTGPRRHGYATTLRCMWYAQGAMVVAGVPVCGYFLSWIGGIWAAVAGAMMIREAQGVSTGRAVMAMLAPALCFIGLLVAVALLSPLPQSSGVMGP